jgi:hypothetical protein
MIIGAVGCDPKGSDSDSSELTASSTDGDSTDGVSSTGGGDEPATTTASPGTATSGEYPGDPTGQDPTAGTGVGTSHSGSTSHGTDTPPEDPQEPIPCEGEAVALDAASLAYTWAQVPPKPAPGDTTAGPDEPGLDPDTLLVELSSQAATCGNVNEPLKCGSNWKLSLTIPPAWQAPGIYHLNGPQVIGHILETGPDEGGDMCWGGGGSIDGTLEIISVDDNEIKGRLCHVNVALLDNVASLDGSFTAPRCQ